jgi:outer membrane receptor for ferrienterochelin and colicin
MMKTTISIILFLLMVNTGFAQPDKIHIEAKNKNLSLVLLEMRDRYDYHFSYSESELARFKVSVSKTFNSKHEAIAFLIKDLPLKLQQQGGVYIIIPDKNKIIEKNQPVRLSGTIVDAETFEPLPYSHIIINKRPTISDVNGSFAFTASADTDFNIHVSHLGYFILDTLLSYAPEHRFELKPSPRRLPEVKVSSRQIARDIVSPRNNGAMQLNSKITAYLPGQGDNAVFNHLRLMPGIQAAGEQTTDLLMWGSTNGQSRIIFDGFTLFGMKNYNDNIGVINPFMVKNIEIIKGGADARYGNHVGGIVNISGKNGSQLKPTFNVGLSNTALNGMAEIPLFGNSSLVAAYRQTFYNLYDAGDFNIFAPTRPQQSPQSKSFQQSKFETDIAVYPESYTFRDLNLKYSIAFDNGDMGTASFYSGGDFFNLTADASFDRNLPGRGRLGAFTPIEVAVNSIEENKQTGFSAIYAHRWNNGNTIRFNYSRSGIKTSSIDHVFIREENTEQIINNDSIGFKNNVVEHRASIENDFSFTGGHTLRTGIGIATNDAGFTYIVTLRDTLRFNNEVDFRSNRFYLFADDYLPLNSRLIFKPGLRVLFTNTGQTPVFVEPRLKGSFKLNEQAVLNASWGMFNQFLYKIATVDKDQNYTWQWVTHNGRLPVLKATQSTVGANFKFMDFSLNVDAYYKTTRNISRQYFSLKQTGRKTEASFDIHTGDSRSMGLDVYLHRQLGQHVMWASYTLSETTERLAKPGTSLPEYNRSPFDQKHELKLAALFNFGSFYLSGNYVYGSGVELLRTIFPDNDNVSYNRVDAAVTYRLGRPSFTFETGVSVLNVFDTQNLKHDNRINVNFERNIGSVKVYSDAVPFTPMVFVKVEF